MERAELRRMYGPDGVRRALEQQRQERQQAKAAKRALRPKRSIDDLLDHDPVELRVYREEAPPCPAE